MSGNNRRGGGATSPPPLSPGGRVGVAGGAWGQKSDAIRQAVANIPAPPSPGPPPPSANQNRRGVSGGGGGGGGGGGRGNNHSHHVQRQRSFDPNGGNNNSNNNRNNSGGGRGGRGGGRDNNNENRGRGRGGGRGGRGGYNNNNRGGSQHQQSQQQRRYDNNSNNRNNNNNNNFVPRPPVDLLEGSESDPIRRISCSLLINLRLDYMDPSPLGDPIPDEARWRAQDRFTLVEMWTKAPRYASDNLPANHQGGGDRRRPSHRNGPDNSSTNIPTLEDVKPLEVNEETRWKPSVLASKKKPDDAEEQKESDDDVLKRALMVLNKLSLTKFDKLSEEFAETGIGRSKSCLAGAIDLIVAKAQDEPHFSAMYAMLCQKLHQRDWSSQPPPEGAESVSKAFKKLLLQKCQDDFDHNRSSSDHPKLRGITDPEELQYQMGLMKKRYIGHMTFIGELYKVGNLINIKIMVYCLPALLEGDNRKSDEEKEKEDDDSPWWTVMGPIDEEKVECFAKLMSTIGSRLEQHASDIRSSKPEAFNKLKDCWNKVEVLSGAKKVANPPVVSNRIRFMLQDLLEMRSKGWVSRRMVEQARTIEQIHEEVAKEEAAQQQQQQQQQARRSVSANNLRAMGGGGGGSSATLRRSLSGDVRNFERRSSARSIQQSDADGFFEVGGGGGGRFGGGNLAPPTMRRSVSDSRQPRPMSGGGRTPNFVNKRPDSANLHRSTSTSSESERTPVVSNTTSAPAPPPPMELSMAAAAAEAAAGLDDDDDFDFDEASSTPPPSLDACVKGAENALKEYFVSTDMDEAVLCLQELVRVGDDGSTERGAKVVEGSILMVLEMKDTEVSKCVEVLRQAFQQDKIQGVSFVFGLQDPLEFLWDIAIDAPKAPHHLADMIASFMKMGAVPSLDFLLSSPESFRTHPRASLLGALVCKHFTDDENARYMGVVEKLMSEKDRSNFSSVEEFVQKS